jgi:phytanoyl-CoA hydroxylase
LEECLETNGALYFLPGSHLISPITKRFIRLPDNKGTGFEPLPSSLKNPKESGSGTNSSTNDDDYVLVTCEPGLFLSFFKKTFHAIQGFNF